MADTRWLERRAHTWHVVMDVPRPLRAVMGKKRLVRSLKTHDLLQAQIRRFDVVAEFKAQIAAAQNGQGKDSLTQDAMEWRRHLAEAGIWDAKNPPAGQKDGGPWGESAESSTRGHIVDAAERIEERHGEAAALRFHAIATGKETPMLHHVDAWLAEGGQKGPLRPRTERQYRSDVGALEAWLRSVDLTATVEAVTKRVAGRYVSEAMVAGKVDRKTANRKISAASAYWRWLVKRGHVEANPWTGQSLTKAPQGQRGGKARKRPFTEEEARTLLKGPADQELSDAMRIAALSGMRLEEIYRLTVERCGDGWFRVRGAKTEAGERDVPMHSALAAIVARRTKGKPPTAFLFPEAGAPREGRERSMAVSKRFGHYRQRLHVHDRAEGQRQSAVDFHSWRRWFITMAEQAGQPPHIISAVVGHEEGRKGMTLGLYSGGPADAQKRACVEAVALPR